MSEKTMKNIIIVLSIILIIATIITVGLFVIKSSDNSIVKSSNNPIVESSGNSLKDEIIGTWGYTEGEVLTEYTFKQNGETLLSMTLLSGGYQRNASGTYIISGNEIIIEYKDTNVKGVKKKKNGNISKVTLSNVSITDDTLYLKNGATGEEEVYTRK